MPCAGLAAMTPRLLRKRPKARTLDNLRAMVALSLMPKSEAKKARTSIADSRAISTSLPRLAASTSRIAVTSRRYASTVRTEYARSTVR